MRDIQLAKGCLQMNGKTHNEAADGLWVRQWKDALTIICGESLQSESRKGAKDGSRDEESQDMD